MSELRDGEVVKIDVLGRIRIDAKRREALMEEFAGSGMSGQQFAKWAGIKYTTFANWRQKQRRELAGISKEPRTAKAVQWVEAVVEDPAASSVKSAVLMIELGGGLRLTIGDSDQARLAGVVLREMMKGNKPC